MQRDYFSQMQANQTGTPTEQEISVGPGQQAAPIDNIAQAGPMMEQMGGDMQADLQEAGLPTGQSKEDIRARLMAMIEELEILEGLSNEEVKEVEAELDKAITALEKGDVQAFQNNPVIQLIGSIMGAAGEMGEMNQGQGPTPEQMKQMEQEAEAADQETAPDMASMAGMTGGNL